MSDSAVQFLSVGDGAASRSIATLKRESTTAAGTEIVFLGGFRSDMEGSKAVALDTFAAASGRALTRLDYSGHGRSGGRFEDGTIGRWLEECLAVFDALVRPPAIVVGSSMGGWLALLLALARPGKVAGLVLIAPAPDFTTRLMEPSLPPAAHAALARDGVWLRPSEYAAEPYPITRALIEESRAHLLLDGPIDVGCPVHILQGVEDADVPWHHATDLVARLAGDAVVLTLIKDGDHRLSRPQDLARLIAAVEGIEG